MKKLASVLYYIEDMAELKTYEYNETCGIYKESELVHIQIDGELQLVVNEEHFISLERIEK